MSDILSQLHQVLESRKGADPDSSYVASLYASGADLVAETLVHLQFFQSSKRLRRSGFVHTPTVAVNEHVANSFDMVFHDIDSLREALEVSP